MAGTVSSPGVTRISWGRVEVEGLDGSLRDAKLYPGGSREWDWNETGTRHAPGIGPGDVEELLDQGAEVVILSRGFHGRLGVREETLRMLEERGVAAHVLLTEEAVRLYNDLREDERVGALIHSTC
jgi:hypothetical protein